MMPASSFPAPSSASPGGLFSLGAARAQHVETDEWQDQFHAKLSGTSDHRRFGHRKYEDSIKRALLRPG